MFNSLGSYQEEEALPFDAADADDDAVTAPRPIMTAVVIPAPPRGDAEVTATPPNMVRDQVDAIIRRRYVIIDDANGSLSLHRFIMDVSKR